MGSTGNSGQSALIFHIKKDGRDFYYQVDSEESYSSKINKYQIEVYDYITSNVGFEIGDIFFSKDGKPVMVFENVKEQDSFIHLINAAIKGNIVR
jgi:hypothetical protein